MSAFNQGGTLTIADLEQSVIEHARYTDSDTRMSQAMLRGMGMSLRDRLVNEREQHHAEADWCHDQIALARLRIATPLTSQDVPHYQRRIHTLLAKLAAAEAAELAAIVALAELDWTADAMQRAA